MEDLIKRIGEQINPELSKVVEEFKDKIGFFPRNVTEFVTQKGSIYFTHKFSEENGEGLVIFILTEVEDNEMIDEAFQKYILSLIQEGYITGAVAGEAYVFKRENLLN